MLNPEARPYPQHYNNNNKPLPFHGPQLPSPPFHHGYPPPFMRVPFRPYYDKGGFYPPPRPLHYFRPPPPPPHFPSHTKIINLADRKSTGWPFDAYVVRKKNNVVPPRYGGVKNNTNFVPPHRRRSTSDEKNHFGVFHRRNIIGSIWRPKKQQEDSSKALPVYDLGEAEAEAEAELHNQTTVMLKNVPCKLSRSQLIGLLDHHCYEENSRAESNISSEYNFVYLPIDFKTGFSLGYAFVNFTNPVAAVRFYKSFHQFLWSNFKSSKVGQVKHAKIQGKDQLVKHFKNMFFVCDQDEYLPLMFAPPRDGSTSTECIATTLGTRRSPRH